MINTEISRERERKRERTIKNSETIERRLFSIALFENRESIDIDELRDRMYLVDDKKKKRGKNDGKNGRESE